MEEEDIRRIFFFVLGIACGLTLGGVLILLGKQFGDSDLNFLILIIPGALLFLATLIIGGIVSGGWQ